MRVLILLTIAPVILTIALPQEARVAVSPKAEGEAVRSYYSEAEGQTTASVFISLPIQIFGERSRLDVNAHFSYEGRQQSAAPKDVQVVFSVPCAFGSELDSDPVICVDGECSSYRPRGEGYCSGGLGRERTSRMVDLPAETFLRIASGREVKLRLHSSEAELTCEQAKTLLRLAAQLRLGGASERP